MQRSSHLGRGPEFSLNQTQLNVRNLQSFLITPLSQSISATQGSLLKFHFHEASSLALLNHTFLSSLKLVSGATDSNIYSGTSYFLYSESHSIAAYCVYGYNEIYFCFLPNQLDSSQFSAIWFKVNCHFVTNYIYALYLHLTLLTN